MASKGRELLIRTLMGVILVPLAILGILYANSHAFATAILILILLSTYEISKMTSSKRNIYSRFLLWLAAIITPFSIYIGMHYSDTFNYFICFLIFFIILAFLLKMFSKTPTNNVLEEVGANIIAAFYIPLFFSFTFLIWDISPYWVLFLCVVIWVSDSFAYFVGSLIGRHKLIPLVSPGKSVEGLIGGAIFALVAALIFNHFLLERSIVHIVIIALDVIAAGVVGDLVESMMKRSFNVKDSGGIIPGHGGIFDRFDALILAAPVLYFYIRFLNIV